MNINQFVEDLANLNINLAVNGDNLKCIAPSGVLTSDLTAKITAHKSELIAFLKQSSAAETNLPNNIRDSNSQLEQFYRAITPASSQAVQTELTIQHLLRFAPFMEVIPGFAFIELFLQPEKLAQYQERIAAAQAEMMEVLFRGIDFSALTTVLDIGCGISTDLINLAKEYSHLQLFGYNITPEQIELGNQRIQAAGCQDRIGLYHRNSALDPFPAFVDLVLSFQVIHHMQDKSGVFANIGKYLNNGGIMVAAEILSNLPSLPIEESESSAYFSTRTEWAKLLSQNNLRVVEAVDVSTEIANFLYDANFESNFKSLDKNYDRSVKRHLEGPHELGNLLRRKLAVYFLLTIQKDSFLNRETLLRLNQSALESPTPYSQVILQKNRSGSPQLLSVNIPKLGEIDKKESNFANGAKLLEQEPEQVHSILKSYVKKQISTITQKAIEKIDSTKPLISMGMDSLMFIEIRNRIKTDLDVTISNSQLAGETSIASLVNIIQKKLEDEKAVKTENTKQDWVTGEL